jgi:hypothetical protein|tara:strand:+ start:1299 stop:1418 length:120 start_codon:yes stop_codon:yes gene_type:complete
MAVAMWLLKSGWSLGIKPILRLLLSFRSGGGAALPGGSY